MLKDEDYYWIKDAPMLLGMGLLALLVQLAQGS
jgi:hypothetical protein